MFVILLFLPQLVLLNAKIKIVLNAQVLTRLLINAFALNASQPISSQTTFALSVEMAFLTLANSVMTATPKATMAAPLNAKLRTTMGSNAMFLKIPQFAIDVEMASLL